jgi:hypothetical protein
MTVFVNARRVVVPAGATALDAVRADDAEAAEAVERGARVITDSRGLPCAADATLSAGAILRLIPARGRDDEPAL